MVPERRVGSLRSDGRVRSVEPRASEPEAFPPPSLSASLAPGLARRGAARNGTDGAAGVEDGAGGRRYLIADVDPLDVTGVRTVAVGTVLFLVALLALLPFTDDLRADGRLWWLWTCGAGVGLGLFGIHYCRRRAAAIAREERRGEHGAEQPVEQPVEQPAQRPAPAADEGPRQV